MREIIQTARVTQEPQCWSPYMLITAIGRERDVSPFFCLCVSNHRCALASSSWDGGGQDFREWIRSCSRQQSAITHPETWWWPALLRHNAELADAEAYIFADKSGYLHPPDEAVTTVQHWRHWGRRRRCTTEITSHSE